jgi:transcriptional regulator with XRE-family HTH domain
MDIKDRIIEFLKAENISSASFAQQIGVQPSGISHIFSGRNKPSLDFIVKMLGRYPSLSTEWLLFGKGKMLKESIPGDLFNNGPDSGIPDNGKADIFDVTEISDTTPFTNNAIKNDDSENKGSERSDGGNKAVRIVIFNKDNTFREYFPG